MKKPSAEQVLWHRPQTVLAVITEQAKWRRVLLTVYYKSPTGHVTDIGCLNGFPAHLSCCKRPFKCLHDACSEQMLAGGRHMLISFRMPSGRSNKGIPDTGFLKHPLCSVMNCLASSLKGVCRTLTKKAN